jgi:hypothetical protein
MSERTILSLKLALRFEWRDQDGQNKADQRDRYQEQHSTGAQGEYPRG